MMENRVEEYGPMVIQIKKSVDIVSFSLSYLLRTKIYKSKVMTYMECSKSKRRA